MIKLYLLWITKKGKAEIVNYTLSGERYKMYAVAYAAVFLWMGGIR